MLEDLVKIANRLDAVGELGAASKIDSILLSIAENKEGEVIQIFNPTSSGKNLVAHPDDAAPAQADQELLNEVATFLFALSEGIYEDIQEIQSKAGDLYFKLVPPESELVPPESEEDNEGKVLSFPAGQA